MYKIHKLPSEVDLKAQLVGGGDDCNTGSLLYEHLFFSAFGNKTRLILVERGRQKVCCKVITINKKSVRPVNSILSSKYTIRPDIPMSYFGV